MVEEGANVWKFGSSTGLSYLADISLWALALIQKISGRHGELHIMSYLFAISWCPKVIR